MYAGVILEGGGWITWNIVSDVYILTKGKKSINAEKNENVELTHTQEFFVDCTCYYKMQTVDCRPDTKYRL